MSYLQKLATRSQRGEMPNCWVVDNENKLRTIQESDFLVECPWFGHDTLKTWLALYDDVLQEPHHSVFDPEGENASDLLGICHSRETAWYGVTVINVLADKPDCSKPYIYVVLSHDQGNSCESAYTCIYIGVRPEALRRALANAAVLTPAERETQRSGWKSLSPHEHDPA